VEGSGDEHLYRGPVGVLGRGVRLPGLLRGASLLMRALLGKAEGSAPSLGTLKAK
jgi:hypothetical protein